MGMDGTITVRAPRFQITETFARRVESNFVKQIGEARRYEKGLCRKKKKMNASSMGASWR